MCMGIQRRAAEGDDASAGMSDILGEARFAVVQRHAGHRIVHDPRCCIGQECHVVAGLAVSRPRPRLRPAAGAVRGRRQRGRGRSAKSGRGSGMRNTLRSRVKIHVGCSAVHLLLLLLLLLLVVVAPWRRCPGRAVRGGGGERRR